MQHLLEFLLFQCFRFFINCFPLSLSLKIGSGLGHFTFSVLKIRRNLVLNQLAQAYFFPNSDSERHRLARSIYKNCGKNLVEFCRLPFLGKKYLDRFVQVRGIENLERARQAGQGVLLSMAHLGNWELVTFVLGLMRLPITCVGKTLRNSYFNSLVFRFRSAHGMTMIEHKQAALKLSQTLKKNGIGIIIMDQDAAGDGIFVNFLNRPASTYTTLGALANLFQCPVVPLYFIRKNNLYHEVIFYEPLYINKEGSREERILDLTQRISTHLENQIRRYPDQWFGWLHQRWKTQKPSTKNLS